MSIFYLSESLDVNLVGEKAAHLSFLVKAGFPVPPGIVISVSIFNTYSQGELDIDSFKIKIEQALKNLGAQKFMIRSSAIGEDSEDNSFAGQLESFQSDGSTESIWENIKRCWGSYSADKVISYQEISGRKLNGMGVVVQELIDPQYAGVLFTRSHLLSYHSLVEYVEGHGEKLVSGSINPFQFHYSLNDGSTIGDYQLIFDPLLSIAKRIEKFYGFPCDVEWAYRDGEFYIVQSRPITTPIKGKSVYWSNTNVNENYPGPITPFLYSLARLSYYHYFKNLSKLFCVSQDQIRRLEAAYSNVIGIHGARMYYNMSSIHEILSTLPFGNILIKSFDNFVGYTDGYKASSSKVSLIQKVNFVKEFINKKRELEKNVQAFEQMADAFMVNVDNAVSHEEIKKCYFEFIEIRMHSWYKASLADFYAMAYHGIFGKFCEFYFKSSGAGIQNKLIQAIPGIISSKPVFAMHEILQIIRADNYTYSTFRSNEPSIFWTLLQTDPRLSKLNIAVNSYLRNWGFRCSGELMLTEMNYIEKPESFIALLQQYEKLPQIDPKQLIEEKYQETIFNIKAFKKQIRIHNRFNIAKIVIHNILLNYLIRSTQLSIASRERARYKQASLYFGLKKILNKIEKNFIQKGYIENKGDIFFLTKTEIAEHLEASSIFGQPMQFEIDHRKKVFQEKCKQKFPDDFHTEDGNYCHVDNVEVRNSETNSSSDLKGLCACGGKITGTVKVLNTVLEAGKLNHGDILVTRQTDPGWVVVFPLISGLIVERGGMLSHGAIVSREFGIPAIVGVASATELLKDGDCIFLNADTGEIRIL